MAQINFDATNVPVATALDPIPAGWYPVAAVASELKPNSKNDGAYLEFEFEVMDGQYKGRKLWDRLNLHNPNATAVEIAYKTLSAICHAVGVIQVADSSQLHNRVLMAKVSLRAAGKGQDGKDYDATNEIKGYKGMEAAAAPSVPGAPAQPWMQPAAPAAPPTPAHAPAAPWQQPQAQAQPAAQPAPAQPAQPWMQPAAQPAVPAAPVGAPPWAQPAAAPAGAPAATPAMPAPTPPAAPPWAK